MVCGVQEGHLFLFLSHSPGIRNAQSHSRGIHCLERLQRQPVLCLFSYLAQSMGEIEKLDVSHTNGIAVMSVCVNLLSAYAPCNCFFLTVIHTSFLFVQICNSRSYLKARPLTAASSIGSGERRQVSVFL